MSFFAEIKRRNVGKVGIAYAVTTWILLQLTDVVADILKLPDWVPQLILVILVVGFLPAVILAWAFEMTPDGVKREKDVDRSKSVTPDTGKKLNKVIFALMAIALLYFIWESRFSDHDGAETGPVASTVSEAQGELVAGESEIQDEVDQQSIAVLPFDNRSQLKEDEFFVAGIHDDLLTKLAGVGSLKVISRTSVNKYKETEKTIPEIAAELNVATVMEGAVQRSGNTVRINVQLIDATTDEHIWAEIFDRELTAENLFTIQTEVSEKIAFALEATLTPEEQERISAFPTTNLDAYDAYLAGRQLASRRNAEDLAAARQLLEEAVELDPEFAQAWSSLALTIYLQMNYGRLPFMEARGPMNEAADKALELNPGLGEPWLIRAQLMAIGGQYTESEAAFLKALELSPNSALAHHWYSNYLDDSSARLNEAFEHALQATQLDPLSSIDQLELADVYQKLGRFDEAERHIERVIQRDPEFSAAYTYIGDLKSETGHFDEVLIWARKGQALNPKNPRLLITEARAMANLNDFESFDGIRERIEIIDPQSIVLGFLDMFKSVSDGSTAAALESAQWVAQKLGNAPFLQGFVGFIHMLNHDYDAARTAFEIAEPRVWNPASWKAAYQESISNTCDYAWIMMETGDEPLGRQLLEEVLVYYQQELPAYIQYPERYNASVCYMLNGEPEKALKLIEARVHNRFIEGWWWYTRHPVLQPLHSEQRHKAAMDALQAELLIQRENVQRMIAEGTL